MLLLWIVAASLLGTLAAILLAGLFLVFPDKTRRALLAYAFFT